MRNVNDLNALPSAGKRLFIVADVNHALHLRMFDLEGKMVLDSAAKRFTIDVGRVSPAVGPEPCGPPTSSQRSKRSRS